MFNLFKDEFSSVMSSEQSAFSQKLVSLCTLINDLILEKFSSSLQLYIFDSGSCNDCELELQLLFSPLYDLSSYGIAVTYDASEADILVITGLMTENMYAELDDVYSRLKEPKEIIILGDSLLDFQKTFALKDSISELFPNAFHIEGSPPEPFVILEGLHEYLKKI